MSFTVSILNGKKTPGGAGTLTGHTGTNGHTGHRRTYTHPLLNPPAHPHDRATTDPAADSTAAAPEPTAPRGRILNRYVRKREIVFFI